MGNKIGIIGGGISGVSAAFWLSYKSSDFDITLLEKNNYFGGSIDTYYKDNYTVEAGPNGFLDSKPETLELFKDAGLEDKLLRSNDAARKRFIMRDGKLHKLPEGAGEFFKSEILSIKAKLRLASEIFIPKKDNDKDETIADFARRRLGSEALDYMIAPMVAGIFAGNPEKMSLKSCFPVIYNLEIEYGGLIKALIKKRKKSSSASGPSGVLTSYKGGLKNAITDIVNTAKLNGVIFKNNSEVISIEKQNQKFIVQTNDAEYEFDKLIITSPAYTASIFLKKLNEELANELTKIPYAPIFVAGLGFNNSDVEDDLDGFGYLIPSKEKRKILGALYTSSIFPERAPTNNKLIRVLIGGDNNRWINTESDESLIDIALNETKDTIKHNMQPNCIITSRAEKAIPQYRIGHNEIVNKVEEIANEISNIYIGGNILYGVGINDCTRASKKIVDRILKDIN